MADLYGLEQSGIPPELIARLTGSAQGRKIAEALLAQSMKPVENMGGPGASLSWTQGADKVLKAYLGRKGIDKDAAERSAVADEASAGRKAAMEAFQQAAMGQPGVTPATPMDDEGNAMPSSPAVAGDPRGAVIKARMSPYLQNAKWLDSYEGNLNRVEAREDQQAFNAEQAKQAQAARASDRAAQLEQKAADLAARMQDAALNRESRERMASQQQALLRELGMARAEAAKAAAEARGDARAQAAGAKEAKANESKQMVTTLIGELGGYFDTLDKMGAAVNTDKSGTKNLWASVQASAPGQFVQGAVGSEKQKVRDEIKQMSPMLLNAIRQATQQGARGLDSNAELKFYLQAVTDPTKSVQYNRTAMRILDKAYGLGAGVKGVSDADEQALKDEFKKATQPAAAEGKVVDWNELP